MGDWEEAENDFYQESFATDLNSVSVDSVLDSECLPLHSETSLPSHGHIYGRAKKAKGKVRRVASTDGDAPNIVVPPDGQSSIYTNRKRMRAEVQGLESKDSDSEEAKSARFNDNVVTSMRAWEDAAKLRGSCYSLKFKRKIKKQLERQPVLIDGSMKECINKFTKGWWSIKDALQKRLQSVQNLATQNAACRRNPYDDGGGATEDGLRRHAFAQERRRLFLSIFVSAAAILLPAPQCLLLGESLPRPEVPVSYSTTSSNAQNVSSSAPNDVVLTNNGFLLPDPVEDMLHSGMRFFNFSTSQPLFATTLPLFFMLIWYLVHGFSLLRARVFHLDSMSLFKQVCCSMTKSRSSFSIGQERSFAYIKDQLSHSWRRWHWRTVLVDLVFNGVLLLGLLAILTYIQQKRHFSAVALHEMVLRFGIVAENAYCFLFGALYLVCRYLLPLLLYFVGGGSSECRVNMFAIRAFLLLSSSFALLLFSLLSDFPQRWSFVLQKHLCVHVIVDLGLLFLLIIIQLLPTCRSISALCAFAPCQRMIGFSVVSSVVQFPFDLLSLSFCLVLLPSLVPLIILRNFFSFTLSFVARLRPPMQELSSAGSVTGSQLSVQNLCFLEALNTALCLAMAMAAQYLLLHRGFTECYSVLASSLESLEESSYLLTGFRFTPIAPYIGLLTLFFFFAKSLVHRHEGEKERTFLKSYLHETNEDKEFQKLKQSQWFPNCECFSPQE